MKATLEMRASSLKLSGNLNLFRQESSIVIVNTRNNFQNVYLYLRKYETSCCQKLAVTVKLHQTLIYQSGSHPKVTTFPPDTQQTTRSTSSALSQTVPLLQPHRFRHQLRTGSLWGPCLVHYLSLIFNYVLFHHCLFCWIQCCIHLSSIHCMYLL